MSSKNPRPSHDAAPLTDQLLALGVPSVLALELLQAYGATALDELVEDPYAACMAVPGMDFTAIDDLVRRLGLARPRARLQAVIGHVLAGAARAEGHTCLPEGVCQARVNRFLASHPDQAAEGWESDGATELWRQAVAGLVTDGRLVVDGGRLYLPIMWQDETSLMEDLQRLSQGPGAPAATGYAATDGAAVGDHAASLHRAGQDLGLAMAPAQRQAVLTALASPLTIITGGPGTGKTTVVTAILAAQAAPGVAAGVRLAAPTGRAARRLAELTGHEAFTIHRLLEFGPDEGAGNFRRHRDHPLEGQLLIVDEASMLDLPLAAALFAAVPPSMRVVLIGDVDQLPAVGPGNILGDIIAADIAPVVRLDRIFRQGDASNIILNAHRVRDGQRPLPTGDQQALTADFRLLAASGPRDAAERILAVALEMVSAGLVSAAQCQVLVPARRGIAGVNDLNARLQAALNPPPGNGPAIHRGQTVFRPGDRVMCTRNLYAKGSQGIFNGHIGKLMAIEGAGGPATLTIDFDGECVQFGYDELADLELAYACTVHKSQGSEFEAVIICLLQQHWPLLNRNLLYTAMTRARRWLVLVTDSRAVGAALQRSTAQRRHTSLAARLAVGA